MQGYLTRQLPHHFLNNEPRLKLPIGNGILKITRSSRPTENRNVDLIPYGRGNTTLILHTAVHDSLRIETIEVGERVVFPERRQDGESIFKTKIEEILDFVLPLYTERRGWSDEMVQGLRLKAFATAESTKYIVVRDNATNTILGVIGLTKAPFGKVIFKDQQSQKWVEVYGQFGQTFERSVIFPGIAYLDSPVPILPTEAYLPEAHLNRPSILEQRYEDYYTEHDRLYPYYKGRHSHLWNTEFRPAPGSPFYVSSGVILEPTKFAIAKNIENNGVTRAVLMKEIFSAIFDLHYVTDLNRNGTYLYTYNDSQGVLLYRRMGFHALTAEPIRKDGTNWIILGMSPNDALRAIQTNKFGTDRISEEFSRELEEHLERISLLEASAPP